LIGLFWWYIVAQMPRLTKIHLANLRRRKAGGNRLRQAIELAGVTQTEMSHDLRIPQSYISDVASNRYGTITVQSAHRFAAYFECQIEDLFPKEEEKKRGTKRTAR
jgi:transcriptional regulator with XRE-family HTH domain